MRARRPAALTQAHRLNARISLRLRDRVAVPISIVYSGCVERSAVDSIPYETCCYCHHPASYIPVARQGRYATARSHACPGKSLVQASGLYFTARSALSQHIGLHYRSRHEYRIFCQGESMERMGWKGNVVNKTPRHGDSIYSIQQAGAGKNDRTSSWKGRWMTSVQQLTMFSAKMNW